MNNIGQDLSDINPIDESVMSADEFMLAVAYQCEANMHNIDMAIAGTEYMALRETGQEMVWEGAIGNIVNKHIESCKWLSLQIKRYFKTIMENKKAANLDKFVEKYRDIVKNKQAIVSTKILYSLVGVSKSDIIPFNNVINIVQKDAVRVFTGIMSNARAMVLKLRNESETKDPFDYNDKYDINELEWKWYQTFGKQIPIVMNGKTSYIYGFTSSDAKKLYIAITWKYRHQAKDVKGIANDAIKYLSEISKSNDVFKELYNVTIETINECIDDLTEIAKTVTTTVYKDKNGKETKRVTLANVPPKRVENAARTIHDIGAVISMGIKGYVKVLNDYITLAKQVVIRASKQKSEPSNNIHKESVLSLFDDIRFDDII